MMEREGIRKRFIYENNTWVDHLMYVALPHHFQVSEKKPVL